MRVFMADPSPLKVSLNVVCRRALAACSAIALLLAPHLAAAGQRASSPVPDLLVVGGTPAGVAAALAAARRGQTVALVVSGAELGGILSGAMMDQWDRNLAPDGASVEGGIFAEIYARLGDAFSPATAARTFAAMIAAQPRIDVRYGEMPVGVATSDIFGDARVDAVTFASLRTGARSVVAARSIVDATDAADVAVLAGARYDVGRQDTGIDERAQAVTQMFAFERVVWSELAANYDRMRFGAGGVTERRAWGYARLMRAYRAQSAEVVVRDLNLGLMPDGSVAVNAVDVFGIDGENPRQLERARGLTEREAVHLLGFLRARVRGFERARIGRFAPQVYVRETRHIAGIERLSAADIWFGRIPSDSIGLSSYPIDLHPVDAADRAAFAPLRHVYGIPFGALVPRGLTNVALAGPAISATHLASGSVRVVPSTIEEGEADGVASVVAQRNGIDFETLAASPERLTALRRELRAGGVILGVPVAYGAPLRR